MRSDQWRRKSRWVRSLTGHRCVLFPWLRARQTHHLTYFFLPGIGWNSWGFEFPCWHLVPLSETAHDFFDSRGLLWQQPIRFFANTYLRLSFLFWWSLFNPLWSAPFWIGIYILWLWLLKRIPPGQEIKDLIDQFTVTLKIPQSFIKFL